MKTSQIMEIFGLTVYQDRELKDDNDILRLVKSCKKLTDATIADKPVNMFPAVIGAKAEMLVDGKWIKGKIVEGDRFDDGIVTIEDEKGNHYWCGQDRTDCYREIKEKI